MITICSVSANASVISSLVDGIEARNCEKQLKKDLKRNMPFEKYDIRYLYHLDSSPMLHVFAVYEDLKAEPLETVKMVKHPGQKCLRY